MKYKFADTVFSYECKYERCAQFLSEYQEKELPFEKVLSISLNDILSEGEKREEKWYPYYESLAVLRAVSRYIFINKEGILFHSSALSFKGKGVLFCAPSGTGKSTHASLWRKAFGSDVVMINDDKPFIRKINGEYFAFSSPWDGKHHLSTKTKAPIKAVFFLERSKTNEVESITFAEALPLFLNQTVCFKDEILMDMLLNYIHNFYQTIKVYKLKCNMDLSSAAVAAKAAFTEETK